jgi:hypothetical protein
MLGNPTPVSGPRAMRCRTPRQRLPPRTRPPTAPPIGELQLELRTPPRHTCTLLNPTRDLNTRTHSRSQILNRANFISASKIDWVRTRERARFASRSSRGHGPPTHHTPAAAPRRHLDASRRALHPQYSWRPWRPWRSLRVSTLEWVNFISASKIDWVRTPGRARIASPSSPGRAPRRKTHGSLAANPTHRDAQRAPQTLGPPRHRGGLSPAPALESG